MAEIRIRDQGKITVQDADSSNEVSLQAPSTVASNQEFTLPSTSGSANNLITTNASGVLSMTDINTLLTSDIAWQSTVQYNNITLESGKGYFINTTAGPTTMTLPSSPSAGDFVALKDYAGTFGTNALTIDRNGSNIQGAANNSKLDTNRASVVLVYVDSTEGWLYTVENNVTIEPPSYVTATGGTITTDGDFKVHTFTGDGTFTVTDAGDASTSNTVDYLIIAGAGGGGSSVNCQTSGGGGGAGGYRISFPNPATGGTSVSAQAYPVTIGAGGAGGANPNPYTANAGAKGSNSVWNSITSAGGGAGGAYSQGGCRPGGSGGGAGTNPSSPNRTGGTGNTPPVNPSQGNNGGTSSGGDGGNASGGGGGIGGVGGNASGSTKGPGGAGSPSTINGSNVTRAAGGSGQPNCSSVNSTAGSANTGDGGSGSSAAGGVSRTAAGGAGGSGIVIIRYKYQN
jgi:hypothetical protein